MTKPQRIITQDNDFIWSKLSIPIFLRSPMSQQARLRGYPQAKEEGSQVFITFLFTSFMYHYNH